MSKKIYIPLIASVLILLATLGYFVFQNQLLIKKLNSQPESLPPQAEVADPQTSPTSSPSQSPKSTLLGTQSAIRSHINIKDYKGLTTYMTEPKVNFTLMSSECCGPQTPQEAADQLSYLDEGIPFDFNQKSEIIQTLKTKNANLSNAFIGTSTKEEHLVAFFLNDQFKISGIEVSISWKLYSY